MFTSSFKDLFKAFGLDRTKSPMLSREERLTRSMPPVVVEMLEQRRLLSYSIEVNGATMEITGSVNGDTISVSMSAGSIYVTDIVAGTSSGYNPNPISLIKIVAGAGADSIFINKNDAASTAIVDPCLIYGDAGNDTIDSGKYADTIYGGFGSDTVNPQSDADTDRFYGGADSDVLNAGHSGSDWWGEFELVN